MTTSNRGRDVEQHAQKAADTADKAGAKVQQNPAYRVLVTVGLICFGIVHLLIAWLALQVAFGGKGDASQQGAMQELARQPFGNILLLVVGVGLLTLTLWQLIEAATGHTLYDDRKRTLKRLSSAGRSIAYAALAVTAPRFALTQRGSSGNGGEKATSTLLGLPGGVVLVVILGLIVLAVGISQIAKGVRQSFTDGLEGGLPRWARTLGTCGYAAKGAGYSILGVLFVVAALTHDKEQSERARLGPADVAAPTVRAGAAHTRRARLRRIRAVLPRLVTPSQAGTRLNANQPTDALDVSCC